MSKGHAASQHTQGVSLMSVHAVLQRCTGWVPIKYVPTIVVHTSIHCTITLLSFLIEPFITISMGSTSRIQVDIPELDLVAIAKTTRKTLDRLASFSNMQRFKPFLSNFSYMTNTLVIIISLARLIRCHFSPRYPPRFYL